MTESMRDELALFIDPNALELGAYPFPRNVADRILASDWLQKVKAEAWNEAVKSAHLVDTPNRFYISHGENPYL